MDKLTNREEYLLGELLISSPNMETTQYILWTIGRNNWTRGILSNCDDEHLTEEQQELLESLGGYYSMDEAIEIIKTEDAIREQLISLNVTPYLYENDFYISALLEGEEICEGIDINEIKNKLATNNDI